jgi:inosine/xanthosine triphosphate pyrophosphatase family protein
MRKLSIRYATGNAFKKEEMGVMSAKEIIKDADGATWKIEDRFSFAYEPVKTDEPLERNIQAMVLHKVKSAYRQLLAPCIVEHAGLMLEEFVSSHYPGGLTQPIWDAIKAEGFLKSLAWLRGKIIARAVVGYCDGLKTQTFVGETEGSLADEPRGSRGFYWDTVFCPDGGGGLTYAEISEREGIERKVELSQSTKAVKACLEYILRNRPVLFRDMS